jgi:hypothetical protein
LLGFVLGLCGGRLFGGFGGETSTKAGHCGIERLLFLGLELWGEVFGFEFLRDGLVDEWGRVRLREWCILRLHQVAYINATQQVVGAERQQDEQHETVQNGGEDDETDEAHVFGC